MLSSSGQQAERAVLADALIKDKLSLLTPEYKQEQKNKPQMHKMEIVSSWLIPQHHTRTKEHQLEGDLEPKARTRTRLKRQGDLLEKS